MTHSLNETEPGTEQIDIRERYETQLWMQALDIDERTLRRAVSEAGTRVDNVRKYLQEQMKAAKPMVRAARVALKPAKLAAKPVRRTVKVAPRVAARSVAARSTASRKKVSRSRAS